MRCTVQLHNTGHVYQTMLIYGDLCVLAHFLPHATITLLLLFTYATVATAIITANVLCATSLLQLCAAVLCLKITSVHTVATVEMKCSVRIIDLKTLR
jgi:hypothetical protein